MPDPEHGRVGEVTDAGKLARVAAWVNLAICVGSYAVMLGEVESVLGAGPLILLTGLYLLRLAIGLWFPVLAWLGVGNIAICCLFVGAVNTFNWSPAAAELPFAVAGAAYVGFAGGLAFHIHHRAPRVPGDECLECGYLLIGLTEPRCPECGTPFDPARVRKL